MSTSISGEIGSTVMSTIYDELNKATKTIMDIKDPSLGKMNVLERMFQGDNFVSFNKIVEHYKFKVVILTISDGIKTLFEAKDGLLTLAHAASSRHPLLSPQVETPKTESARQALNDQLYIEELKKEDPLQALIARLSIIGARASVSSKSSAILDESRSKDTSASAAFSASLSSSNQRQGVTKLNIHKAKQQIQDVDKNFAIKIKELRDILKAASVITDIPKNSLQESKETIEQFQSRLDLVSIVVKKIDLMLKGPEQI